MTAEAIITTRLQEALERLKDQVEAINAEDGSTMDTLEAAAVLHAVERLARWEKAGRIARDCQLCFREVYSVIFDKPLDWEPWMPSHTPHRPDCKARNATHCTCDGCF